MLKPVLKHSAGDDDTIHVHRSGSREPSPRGKSAVGQRVSPSGRIPYVGVSQTTANSKSTRKRGNPSITGPTLKMYLLHASCASVPEVPGQATQKAATIWASVPEAQDTIWAAVRKPTERAHKLLLFGTSPSKRPVRKATCAATTAQATSLHMRAQY